LSIDSRFFVWYSYYIKTEGELRVDFKNITSKQAEPFILNKHYAHRKPSISYAFGVYINDKLKGIVTFGSPASPNLCRGVCGDEYKNNVIELNRLFLDDDLPKNTATQLLSFAFKQLKTIDNFIIISYADTGMGHTGAVYQASSFLYTGLTKARTDKFSGIGKHSRHYDKNEVEKYRSIRTSKFRYIKFIGTKTFRKNALKALNYPIMDYVKEDTHQYNIGDSEPQYLVDVETKEIINANDLKED